MRKMNIFGKHTLLIFLITAMIGVGQAVFLLLNNSNGNALAAGAGIALSADYYRDGVNLSWLVENGINVEYGYKLIVSLFPDPLYPGSGSDAVRYIEYPETMHYQWRSPLDSDTTYYFRICQYRGGGICGVYSNTVAVTTMPDMLTINILKPFMGELVFGEAYIKAKTNFGAESVSFNISSEQGYNHYLEAENLGNNLFAAVWNTDDANISDGNYTIGAFAYKPSGWEAMAERSVIIDSVVRPSVAPRILAPVDGNMISGVKTVLVEVDSNIGVDKVYITWPGTQIARREMTAIGNDQYTYGWDSGAGEWNNENYVLRAEAEAGGAVYESSGISLVVDNINNIIDPPSEPSEENLRIEFISPSGSISEATTLEASTSIAADVVFWVYQDTAFIREYIGERAGNYIYFFSFDPGDLNNNNYLIKAVASRTGHSSQYDTITITANKPEEAAAGQEYTIGAQAEVNENYSINFIEAPREINASSVIKAKTNFSPYTVKFLVREKNSASAPAEYSANRASGMKYYFWLDTSKIKPGEYIVRALARKGDQYYEDSTNIIYKAESVESGDDPTLNETDNNIQENEAIPESLEADTGEAITEDESENKSVIPETTEDPVKIDINEGDSGEEGGETTAAGDENLSGQEENITIENTILPECREQEIATPEECRRWLALPESCREQGISKAYRCTAYLNLPPECRENAVALEDCPDFLDLPLKCRLKGIASENECRNYLFTSAIPSECRQAGTLTHLECREYLGRKIMPLACRERELKSEAECAQLLNSQTAATERPGIAPEAASQKEGESEAGGSFDPRCVKVGIASIKRCQIYIEQKGVAPECRFININNKDECDAYLLEKYSMRLCSNAGVIDKEECEAYIFNSIQGKINCDGGGEWQCQNIIKNNYLGIIALKQGRFNELKNKAASLGGSAIKAAEFEKKFARAQEIIPIIDREVNIKFVGAKESVVLAGINELIQTSPVVLMFDSDGDGLTDDMEKRLGTNPEKEDSDGDGYSDLDELQAGYNPLGPGNILKKTMAPVEEAILEGREIGHARTDGKENSKFKIATVENNETQEDALGADEDRETGQGYTITGVAAANSILTLYIYSDLPVVTTVKTDAYGNWRYEFKYSLIDGEHEAYIALNDNTGRVLSKSKPFSFFVKEARAVSVNDYIAVAAAKSAPQTESMIDIYLIIASVTIVVGLLLFVLFFLMQKRKQRPV